MTTAETTGETTAETTGGASVPRMPDVSGRMEALDQVVATGAGRLDSAGVDQARRVLDRAERRMRASAEHTVVAVGGATGSGKSSLFNAVTGLELAGVGVRRPTTAQTLACVWGPHDAGALLDWLEIPERNRLTRESPLDEEQDSDLAGLVLLDLPDHDSIREAHQSEVDRIAELADLLVWVVDPQKYADQVLHERYLRQLSHHEGVVLVVLNRVDQLRPQDVGACVADLRRLLADDGLADAQVATTSAATGQGVGEFRTLLAETVAAKRSAGERLSGDAAQVAEELADGCGEARVPQIDPRDKDELVDAFAQAAGVPAVVDAVDRWYRHGSQQAGDWPPAQVVRRLRGDPLRQLRLLLRKGLEDRSDAVDPARIRASRPEPTPVQRARVDTAVRGVVDSAVYGLTHPWVASVRAAARARQDELGDALDGAVTSTDLGVSQRPAWWQGIRVVQLVLVGLLAIGAVATVLGVASGGSGWAVAAPLLVVGVSAVAGLALGGAVRAAGRSGGRQRADDVEQRFRTAIGEVAKRMVFTPIEEELESYRTCRDALATVRRR